MRTTLYTLLVLFLIGTTSAHARVVQQTIDMVQVAQKISIEDGQVFVIGKRVDASKLPAGLQQLGKDVNMSFWTKDEALLEINGQTFVFEEGLFREADPQEKNERNVMVVFSSEKDGPNVRLYEAPHRNVRYTVATPEGVPARAMDTYVAQLRKQAEEFNKLTFELKEVVPEGNDLARQLVVEAENAARIANILPRVEYEAYLGSLQQENMQLYEELQRERDMEMRTHRLAHAARSAESEAERNEHMEELRSVLTEIFELKQANRRKEIKQLEQQLTQLNERLAERESLKKDIIESRLADLMNLHRW